MAYGKEQLIKLNPDSLEEHTANLATLIQQICSKADDLSSVNKTAQTFWNEGVGEDVSSYITSLDKNINLINNKLATTLNDYVKTMNVLASTVRAISNQTTSNNKQYVTSMEEKNLYSSINEYNDSNSAFFQFGTKKFVNPVSAKNIDLTKLNNKM